MSRQTPLKKLRHIALVGDKDDAGVLMEIAPTMKSIVIEGKRYFRMEQARQIYPDGTEAAMYLWDGYGKRKLAEIRARESLATDA